MSADGPLRAGPLEIQPAERAVRIEGSPARVSGKPFDVLLALARASGRLVSKEDLIEEVWEGRAVSDAVLTTAIRELRQALGDDARAPRFVETVHGRGYRLLVAAPPEAPQSPQSPTAVAPQAPSVEPDRRTLILAGGGAALLAAVFLVVTLFSRADRETPPAGLEAAMTEQSLAFERTLQETDGAEPAGADKSVAVLTFADLSEASDRQWFVEGLTAELTAALSRNPDLRVVSPVARIEAGDAPPVLAERFEVAHLLTGSARWTEGRVRIAARLVDADGAAVWSETYDREDADIIAIQEEIAYEIARALKTVTDPERLRAMVEAGTRSVDAYQAVLNGHHFMQQQYVTGDAAYRARAYEAYDEARDLDPGFAEAHWLAARFWLEQATFIRPPGADLLYTPKEIAAAFSERIDAAAAAAPDSVSERKYRAARHFGRREYRAAQRGFDAYLADRPSDVYAWVQLARVAAYTGDFEVGRRAAERIAALSDEFSLYYTRTIPVYRWVRDFTASAEQGEIAMAVSPDNAFVQYHAHRAFLWIGEVERAAALVPLIEAGELPEHNRRLSRLRQACAEGDLPTARATYEAIIATPRSTLGVRWLAHLLMNDEEAARVLLEPFDTEDGLAQLAAWMTFPQFNSALYPELTRRLAADGIDRPPPVAEPFRCPAA